MTTKTIINFIRKLFISQPKVNIEELRYDHVYGEYLDFVKDEVAYMEVYA